MGYHFSKCPICNKALLNGYSGRGDIFLNKVCYNTTHRLNLFFINEEIKTIELEAYNKILRWDCSDNVLYYSRTSYEGLVKVITKPIVVNWIEPIFDLQLIQEKLDIIDAFI